MEYEAQAPGLGVQMNYVVAAHRLVADIYIAQQRGMYSDVRQLYDGVVALGPGAAQLKARVGEFAYQRSGVEMHSRLYLLARKNHFIKLRISVPQANAGVAPALMRELLDDLAQLLSQEPR